VDPQAERVSLDGGVGNAVQATRVDVTSAARITRCS
jgi:hypothetical protein